MCAVVELFFSIILKTSSTFNFNQNKLSFILLTNFKENQNFFRDKSKLLPFHWSSFSNVKGLQKKKAVESKCPDADASSPTEHLINVC